MLSRRDYGKAERFARMKQYMYEKNKGIVDEPLIELVLERLSEQYFHDDDRVAGLLMQGYFRKGYN